MLIRLIISPADENRSGANQMRQHRSFREHFRRGNAPGADHCRDRGVAARVGNMMGELVMEALATLDQVAFIRSASVYRNFREAKDFGEFVGQITADDD